MSRRLSRSLRAHWPRCARLACIGSLGVLGGSNANAAPAPVTSQPVTSQPVTSQPVTSQPVVTRSVAIGKRWCPPDCEPGQQTPDVAPDAPGRWYPGFAMRALSLRGSLERTRVDTSGESAVSFGIEQRALAHLSLGMLSARYSDFATIGGGNAGVDGGLGADVAIGVRPLFGPGHGPVIRLGGRAHLLYGGRFHSSLIELPQLQLGYGIITSRFQFEIAARGGFTLVGRYAVEGATSRHLGGAPEYGGYLSIGARPIRLEVEIGRIAAETDRFGTVDSLDGLLCGALPIPTVCLHAQALVGDAASHGIVVPTRASFVGLTVGIGADEWR